MGLVGVGDWFGCHAIDCGLRLVGRAMLLGKVGYMGVMGGDFVATICNN